MKENIKIASKLIFEFLVFIAVIVFIFCVITILSATIDNEIAQSKIENKQKLTQKYEAWTKLTGNPKQLTVEEFEILIKNDLLK